jgi:hypothetical protein
MLNWKSLLYSDKPQTLSVKNFLIRKMSTAANIPEKVISSVVDHQFAALIENMPTCNTLEISGFGKFVFHKGKGPKLMKGYLYEQQKIRDSFPNLDVPSRKRAEIELSKMELTMKALNQKLQSYENQFCTAVGGVEKLSGPSRRAERKHSGNSK